MTSLCNVNVIILRPRNDDLEVKVFMFGGGASAPLDEGVYFGVARVVACMIAGSEFINVYIPNDLNPQTHCIQRIFDNFSPPG